MATGTGQREQSPQSNIFPSNSVITTLRTNMASGSVIYANDVNTLITLINSWLGHYHNYDDAYQLATFGNNGDRTNYTESKNSSDVTSSMSISTISGVTSGDTIVATKHNEMRNRCSTMAHHYHSIDDRTS
jgi:hypothetical protein